MRKVIFGVSIIACIIVYSIIGFSVLLCLFPKNEIDTRGRVYFPKEMLQVYFVDKIKIIRSLTECKDFPVFEVRELWYDKMSGDHSEPHLECYFKKEMTKEEFLKFSKITNNIYWRVAKDSTLRFSRGWTKKEYMKIPVGMMEDMEVKIEHLSQSGFTLSFRPNKEDERIDGDFLNKLTGKLFPAYSVVHYNNKGESIHAKLQFENLVDKKSIEDIRALDTLVIKYNGKRASFSMENNEQCADLFIRDDIPICGTAWMKYIDEYYD